MSEQNIGMPVNDTDVFSKRVLDFVQKLNVPCDLVELAVKRYPYDEKFAIHCQQDEEVAHLISKITEEGRNFRISKKTGKTAEDHIKKWVCDYTGELTEGEIESIKAYWLGLPEGTAENA